MTDTEKKRLKDKFIQEIDSAADQFFEDFEQACDDSGGVPALSGIEDAAGLLDERTRQILSGLIHETIETVDEEALVESKKAN